MSRPLTAFDRLRLEADRKQRERESLGRPQVDDFPAVQQLAPESLQLDNLDAPTPRSTPRGTQSTPRSTPLTDRNYPAVYPPGLPHNGIANGVPHKSRPKKYTDTRAQLNLKISLEKMFQLKQRCEQIGLSQREAIEEAITLWCSQPATQLATHHGVDHQGTQMGSLAPQIEDREILSIIEFYKAETGNEWTPADQTALQGLSGRVPTQFVSAGIIKSLIGSRTRVETFTYCAKTALQIASTPEMGDGQAYLVDLWRRYDKNKSNIRRKQAEQ